MRWYADYSVSYDGVAAPSVHSILGLDRGWLERVLYFECILARVGHAIGIARRVVDMARQRDEQNGRKQPSILYA